MSAKHFIKDLEDYLVDVEFTDPVKKRIESIYLKYVKESVRIEPVYRDRVIDRTVKEPVYIEKIKTVYIDSVSGKFLNFKRVSGLIQNGQEFDAVVDSVCEYWRADKDKVLGKCRERRYTFPRFFLAHCLREMGMTLTDIGRLLNRDHTTILQQLRVSQNMIDLGQMPYSMMWIKYHENKQS